MKKHTLLIVEEPGFGTACYADFKQGMDQALEKQSADLIEIIYKKVPNQIHPLWDLSMQYIAEKNSDNISISEYETWIDEPHPAWSLNNSDRELIEKAHQLLAFWCGEDDYIGNMISLAEDYTVPTCVIEL